MDQRAVVNDCQMVEISYKLESVGDKVRDIGVLKPAGECWAGYVKYDIE
jgi:hypothetical protein